MARTSKAIDTDNLQGDVIAQLLAQHEQVRAAIDDVAKTTTAESRREAFDQLRELLARHETAEEMILRPLTRRVTGGEDIAGDRMAEENQSKEILADLEKLDIASEDFARTFEKFALGVLTHAQNEEVYEFPLLRQQLDPDRLVKAEKQLLLAEKTAPTHPHPAAKTTTRNYVAGPFAALADRARDAISKVTSS